MKATDLKRIFKQNNWYLTKKKLNSLNISDYFIKKWVGNNRIIQVSSGLYRWKNIDPGKNEELLDIFEIEPSGVLCLYSAMHFYHLSSFISTKYYIAIPREMWLRNGHAKPDIKSLQ